MQCLPKQLSCTSLLSLVGSMLNSTRYVCGNHGIQTGLARRISNVLLQGLVNKYEVNENGDENDISKREVTVRNQH